MTENATELALGSATENLARRTLVATGSAAVIAGACFLAHDVVTFRDYVADELDRHGDVIALQVSAAVEFGDLAAANQILGDLSISSNIASAVVCRGKAASVISSKEILPEFPCSTIGRPLSSTRRVPGSAGSRLLIHGDERVVWRRAKNLALLVCLFILASAGLGFLLSHRIHRVITTLFAQQRATETALALALDQAESAVRAKGRFVANMSHEIRTPLNGMLGCIQLLTGTPMSADQLELAGVLQSSGDTLLTVVNDILDISKMESGKLVLRSAPIDIRAFIRDNIALYTAMAQANGVTLSGTIEPMVPEVIRGDRDRLGQVLSNLISNAVKFTHEGTIRLHVACGASAQEIVFKIEDSGIGIPADRVEQIFRRFEQADTSTTRAYGGSGLGLYIVRELVHMMGGQTSVSSTVGKGSIFSFTIKAVAGSIDRSSERESNVEPIRTTPCDVLLCEDNPVNAMIARRMLERLGCRVALAVDGVEAVRMSEQTLYNLILMDCQMPRMDGYEATREIVARRPDQRVVALTANVMEEDVALCRAAGMEDAIAKPVSIAALRRALETRSEVPPEAAGIEPSSN